MHRKVLIEEPEMSTRVTWRRVFLALVFAVMGAAAVLAFLKDDTAAVIAVTVSAAMLLSIFAWGVVSQKGWKDRSEPPFPSVGDSGAVKSRQTHLPW